MYKETKDISGFTDFSDEPLSEGDYIMFIMPTERYSPTRNQWQIGRLAELDIRLMVGIIRHQEGWLGMSWTDIKQYTVKIPDDVSIEYKLNGVLF